MDTIWITWEQQRRNWELSSALNIPLFEMLELHSLPKWKKYFVGVVKTLKLLWKEKPNTVVCQNPSIILAALMVTVKYFTRIKVIVDAHYVGITPHEDESHFLNKITRFLFKYTDLTIVTTEGHKQFVESHNGRGIILPDKIPTIELAQPRKLEHKFNLLFICSFAKDEPYQEVFEASKLVSEDIGIYVTGRYEGKITLRDYPTNIHFLGRIPWKEYDGMLQSVDGCIDLTTVENCLVCGAYETVAVEKPLLLSDTVALKSYFNKGAVYTDNDRYSIARAMHELILNKDQLTKDVKQLKIELQQDWEQRKQKLLAQIGD